MQTAAKDLSIEIIVIDKEGGLLCIDEFFSLHTATVVAVVF